ncbi:MAG: hypothetical protein IH608_07160, partial [Proteobacteria bacterium]|nr:hypothetical protein [Pseudomonadota bacterium]
MKLLRAFGGLTALLLLAGAAGAAGAPVRDLEARLARMVAAGELAPDRADLYRLYAVVAAERLPAELRVVAVGDRAWRVAAGGDAGADPLILRCGTPLL